MCNFKLPFVRRKNRIGKDTVLPSIQEIRSIRGKKTLEGKGKEAGAAGHLPTDREACIAVD